MPQAQIKQTISDSAQILRVVSSAPQGLMVTAHSGPAEPWCVRCALPPSVRVRAGDEVVVLASSEGPVAVARVRSAEEIEHALSDGTRVKLDAAHVSVQRADGTPLFDYRVESGRGTVTLSAEALALSATAGDLQLQAAGDIRLRSRALSFQSAMPNSDTSLELQPRGVRLKGESLALESRNFALRADEARLAGREVQTSFQRAVVKLERLDAAFDVAVSRARNVYQSVQELLQQQAGSLRTLVAGSAQLKAREVAHRAEEAYKVRAEKIHLG